MIAINEENSYQMIVVTILLISSFSEEGSRY